MIPVPSFSQVTAIEKSLVKGERNRFNYRNRRDHESHRDKAIRVVRGLAMKIVGILDQCIYVAQHRHLASVGVKQTHLCKTLLGAKTLLLGAKTLLGSFSRQVVGSGSLFLTGAHVNLTNGGNLKYTYCASQYIYLVHCPTVRD